MAPRRRRMVDPDYAGQVRAGIGAKMNGQMTSSNSFKAFQTPMGGGYSLEQGREFEARRRAAEVGAAPVRDRFNPATAQATVDSFGFGVGPSGNFEVNPAILALNFLPFGRIFGPVGKIAKAVVPKATRIAAAGERIAARAAATNAARRAGATELRENARKTFDNARDLRRPTFIGSDLYSTTSRQVDALSDSWERTSTRVGQEAGPSAWQRAQDAAAQTGRTVATGPSDYVPGLSGTTYRLIPTGKELNLADQLDRGAGALVRQADDLARSLSPYANNPAMAAREVERRLRALKTTPVRRTPWREPRNPAL